MKEIIFRAMGGTFGMPDPFVPDGTIVILLQRGRAEVARYEAATPSSNRFPSLAPARNWEDLETDALLAIRKAFPHHVRSKRAHVYWCPTNIAKRAIWA